MDAVKILLDTPAARPALGFGNIAAALAKLIEQSDPRFAVGVFGGWGSGKTTLMQAIQRELRGADTLTVFFNAWRYEREPHLIVPLLDTIRGSLMKRAEGQPPATRERIVEIARKVGRVVRALASGLSAEVEVPGFAKLSYDLAQAMDGLSPARAEAPETAQSLYFACFEQLNDAFAQLEGEGVERVVVFVDDLDRCLPASALDVVESMKLFFDLPGFVFIVGIDQLVLERAVRARIAGLSAGDAATSRPVFGGTWNRVAEREYVKKIFQLPFELPPMAAEQLDELLTAIYETAGLDGPQLEDLRGRVRRYLAHVAIDGQVNPREVKRFINAYTLQMLVRPHLDRDTVLAVQTLAFRDDWPLFDALRVETDMLPRAIRSYRDGQDSALIDLWPEIGTLPTDLARFLRSPQGEVLAEGDLRMYVTSVESTVRPERWLAEAYALVATLRRTMREYGEKPHATPPVDTIRTCVDQFTVLLTEAGQVGRLVGYLNELRTSAVVTDLWDERRLGDMNTTITDIQRELRVLRGLAFSSMGF